MRWLERLEEGLIALLLGSMTLITFSQVVARYVFNYSFVWALELTTTLFAWLIFLGMSYGVRVGSHIGVDAFVKTLSPNGARIVAAAAALLCIVYAGIVLVGGSIYVGKMYDLGIEMEDLPFPQWAPRVVLPLGFALLGLRFAQLFVQILKGKQHRLVGDEAAEALKLREPTGPDGGSADSR
jgi:C4-dicarboxylate transporter, DctQ subunit